MGNRGVFINNVLFNFGIIEFERFVDYIMNVGSLEGIDVVWEKVGRGGKIRVGFVV